MKEKFSFVVAMTAATYFFCSKGFFPRENFKIMHIYNSFESFCAKYWQREKQILSNCENAIFFVTFMLCTFLIPYNQKGFYFNFRQEGKGELIFNEVT